MTRMHRAGALLGTFLIATAVVAAGTAPAAAAPPSDPTAVSVLIFDNPNVVDDQPGEELERLTAAITPMGATITTFDGGDGSATAWTTALAGVHVLALSEPEMGLFWTAGGTAWVSDEAMAAIADWVEAGGYIVASGSWDSRWTEVLNLLTGKDYGPVDGVSDSGSLVWELQADVPGAPPTLAYIDGTYGFNEYGTWSDDLKSIVTPIYLTADEQDLAVGVFAVGTGAFVYVGYDWYDGTSDETRLAAWTTVQQLAVLGFPLAAVEPEPEPTAPPAPELAATGTEALAAGGTAAGVLLLVGGAVLLLRRRATV